MVLYLRERPTAWPVLTFGTNLGEVKQGSFQRIHLLLTMHGGILTACGHNCLMCTEYFLYEAGRIYLLCAQGILTRRGG